MAATRTLNGAEAFMAPRKLGLNIGNAEHPFSGSAQEVVT
jgi:hypothetical protein